jgi:hypothetical protein
LHTPNFLDPLTDDGRPLLHRLQPNNSLVSTWPLTSSTVIVILTRHRDFPERPILAPKSPSQPNSNR